MAETEPCKRRPPVDTLTPDALAAGLERAWKASGWNGTVSYQGGGWLRIWKSGQLTDGRRIRLSAARFELKKALCK